jgi:hypothetical protein
MQKPLIRAGQASRRGRRRSRLMRFRSGTARETCDRGQRDAVARLRYGNDLRRWRGQGGGQRQAADAAAIGANPVIRFIALGRGLPGHIAVAKNIVRLCSSLGGGARASHAPDQARQRDRVSSDERNNALPNCPVREPHAHNLSPPLVDYDHPSGKEIPSPAPRLLPQAAYKLSTCLR